MYVKTCRCHLNDPLNNRPILLKFFLCQQILFSMPFSGHIWCADPDGQVCQALHQLQGGERRRFTQVSSTDLIHVNEDIVTWYLLIINAKKGGWSVTSEALVINHDDCMCPTTTVWWSNWGFFSKYSREWLITWLFIEMLDILSLRKSRESPLFNPY